jgi:hypothetical protein
VIHCNVQGLLGSYRSNCVDIGCHSKIDFIRNLLPEKAPVIMCLCETKLSKNIDDSEISIQGFDLFRIDRTRKGGGLAIYCNASLNPTAVLLPNDLFSTKLEVLAIQVAPLKCKPFIVCTIYRPPSLPTAWIQDYYALLNWLTLQKHQSIVLGDFNVDLLLQPDFASEILLSFNIKQHISVPTRITSHSSTLIDHIYSTSDDMIYDAGACELHVSDHKAIYCHIKSDFQQRNSTAQLRVIEYRQFKRLNVDNLLKDLASAPWSIVNVMDDVNDKLQTFVDLFTEIWNAHAPLVKRRVRQTPTPWMNDDVLDHIHKRDHAYRTFIKSRSVEAMMLYKQLRRKTVSAVRNAKRAFFIHGARLGSRQFWKNIKLCTGFGKAKMFRTPWPAYNLSCAKLSANKLNNHFVESVSNIAQSFPPSDLSRGDDCTSATDGFSFKAITAAEVESAIMSLSDTASVGMDNISTKMVKISRKAISGVLAGILNCSLSTMTYPTMWKEATVISVFKKGDKNIMNNYRPIALLPVLSKVFERIIANQLGNFLDSNSVINTAQFGFRRGLSTESALLRLSKLLFTAKQSGVFSSLTTIDFSKAFDCLNHSVLLNRLASYGLGPSSVLWFKSYLTGRHQRVQYASALSDPLLLQFGVPEGSVLGPRLFNLYINSLLDCLPLDSVVAYADDVTLVALGKTAAEATANMQLLLTTVESWATQNMMAINCGKCFSMTISPYIRKQKAVPAQFVTIGGQPVKTVDSLRILGVHFSNDLSWHVHANNVRLKMNRMIGVIKRCGHSINYDTKRKIYNAFIAPHLDYCLPVWGHLPKVASDRMSHCLSRMLRVITNMPFVSFTASTYNETGLRDFPHAVAVRCCMYIFSAVHHTASLQDVFLVDNSVLPTSQISRRSDDANKFITIIPKRATDCYSFQTFAASVWNNLPNVLTRIPNKTMFLKKLDDFYISKLYA